MPQYTSSVVRVATAAVLVAGAAAGLRAGDAEPAERSAPRVLAFELISSISGVQSTGLAINNRGDVAGFRGPISGRAAFLSYRNGSTFLPEFQTIASEAVDINDAGVAVGWAQFGASQSFRIDARRYPSTAPLQQHAQAIGINEAGEILCRHTSAAALDPVLRGAIFIARVGQGFRYVGHSSFDTVAGIDGGGVIALNRRTPDVHFPVNLRKLFPPPAGAPGQDYSAVNLTAWGGDEVTPLGVSVNGNVAGRILYDEGVIGRPFVFMEGVGHDLGLTPPSTFGEATGVTSAGVIVGWQSGLSGPTGHRAFIQMGHDQQRFDLTTIAASRLPAGVTITRARDISEVGWVTGEAVSTVTNTYHPFRMLVDIGSTVDTDGDGLLDTWEIGGIDEDGDGIVDLDLPAMGADPNHKDLFIEVDAMSSIGLLPPFGNPNVPPGIMPTMSCLDNVIHAFADSPVTNPNGQTGVRLHLLLDEQDLPFTAQVDRFFNTFDSLKQTHFGTPQERMNPSTIAAKKKVVRYCILVSRITSGALGQARRSPGADFVVAVDQIVSSRPANVQRQWIAGAFMHELGHCLGLDHGGHQPTHFKPNYPSVMNYLLAGPYAGTTGLWRLDYSRVALPSLDESHLNEAVGIPDPTGTYTRRGIFMPFGMRAPEPGLPCLGVESPTVPTGSVHVGKGVATDWNGNGVKTNTDVHVDINYRGERAWFADAGPTIPCETHHGHDDWSNLVYAIPRPMVRGVPDPADPPEEFSAEFIQEIDDSIPLLGCIELIEEPSRVDALPYGGPVMFTVDVSAGGEPTYEWRRNGVPIVCEFRGSCRGSGCPKKCDFEGIDTPVLVIVNLDPLLVRGFYDCIITNYCNTVITEAAPISFGQACDSDVDGSLSVGFSDVTEILTNWGCQTPGCPGDATLDGMVSFADVTAVLRDFGMVCELNPGGGKQAN